MLILIILHLITFKKHNNILKIYYHKDKIIKNIGNNKTKN